MGFLTDGRMDGYTDRQTDALIDGRMGKSGANGANGAWADGRKAVQVPGQRVKRDLVSNGKQQLMCGSVASGHSCGGGSAAPVLEPANCAHPAQHARTDPQPRASPQSRTQLR
eukprot:22826-Chlamydomonas_euryale.AAC.1